MKVILLKDVQKVGHKYDVKEVADGFALNMLIPRGLASIATAQAVKKIEQMKSTDTEEKRIQHELLLKNLDSIKNLTLKEKANDKGHLFAGVTKEILAEKINVPAEFIKLDKPIKEIGEHKVNIEVGGKIAEFTVVITDVEREK